MQNRFLVGGGPSPNTWPRWAPHSAHVTSVRILPGWDIRSKRFAPTIVDKRDMTGWKVVVCVNQKPGESENENDNKKLSMTNVRYIKPNDSRE